MATPNIVPRAKGEGGLGTAVKGWGKAFITNITADSASQGGKLVLASDDGAAMQINSRLGVIEFQGSESASATTIGARIEAIADTAWSTTENGTSLKFLTTDADASESLVLTLNSDNNALFTGSVTGVNYRTIYIDAGSMIPQVTNGAQAGTSESADAYDIMNDYFAFDTTTAEYVQFKMVMPEQYDGGTIKARFYWKPLASTTTSHDVQWGIEGQSHADGGELGAWGTQAVSVTDEVIATDSTKKVHITPASGDCTIAGASGGVLNELVYFRIGRVVGGDDLPEDAHLLGVAIQYREASTVNDVW